MEMERTIGKLFAAERIEGLAKARRDLSTQYLEKTTLDERKALSEPYMKLESAISGCIEEEAKYLISLSK